MTVIIKSTNGNGPLVIIVTAHGSERMAVEAVKAGAYDYLSKPFELDDLRLVVKNAAETVQLRRENYSLRRRIEVERSQRGALIGNSDAMQKVRAMIDKVAETDATVLVRGESGTGKELVARELHERRAVDRLAEVLPEPGLGAADGEELVVLGLVDRVVRVRAAQEALAPAHHHQLQPLAVRGAQPQRHPGASIDALRGDGTPALA